MTREAAQGARRCSSAAANGDQAREANGDQARPKNEQHERRPGEACERRSGEAGDGDERLPARPKNEHHERRPGRRAATKRGRRWRRTTTRPGRRTAIRRGRHACVGDIVINYGRGVRAWVCLIQLFCFNYEVGMTTRWGGTGLVFGRGEKIRFGFWRDGDGD